MYNEQMLAEALASAFPDSQIHVEDYAGDGDHFRITIESAKFAGLNRVAMQRLVFSALGKAATEIHALQLNLSAPESA